MGYREGGEALQPLGAACRGGTSPAQRRAVVVPHQVEAAALVEPCLRQREDIVRQQAVVVGGHGIWRGAGRVAAHVARLGAIAQPAEPPHERHEHVAPLRKAVHEEHLRPCTHSWSRKATLEAEVVGGHESARGAVGAGI